jgi:hypothetical protein
MSPGTQTSEVLYISNLPYSCDGNEIRDKLSSNHVIVKSVLMPNTQNGQSIGVAFVELLCSSGFSLNNHMEKFAKGFDRHPIVIAMNRVKSGDASVDGITYFCGDAKWQAPLSWKGNTRDVRESLIKSPSMWRLGKDDDR